MYYHRPQTNSVSVSISIFTTLMLLLYVFPCFCYGACGDSWTDYSPSISVNLYCIEYGDSLFVAAGASKVISSPDGETWTDRGTLSSYGEGIVYAPDKDLWVLVGDGGMIKTSSNGTSWTTQTSGTSNDLLDVAYGNGTFIAVGMSGTVRKSTNGTSWSAGGSAGSGNVNHVAFNSSTGRFVCTNMIGQVRTSDDTGSNWTSRQTLVNNIDGLCYGNGKWIAGGRQSTSPYPTRMWKSTNDGNSWSELTVPSKTNYIRGITYTGSNYVVVGDAGLIFTSTDGDSWSDKSDSGSFFAVEYNNNKVVAVGTSSLVKISTCCTKTKGAITDPTSGTLPGPTDDFYWSAGSCLDTTPYRLTIGSSAYGGTDVYDSGWTTSTSKTVTTLTTNAGTAYVRLQTKYSDASTENDDKSLTFAAKASVTSPSTSSALAGATVTFSRDSATGSLAASPYKLIVGSSSGGSQYYDSGWSTASSFTVNNLPTNGSNVYVRIYTKYATNETPSKDYVYTAANFAKATLTAPTQGETLTSKVKTITWNAGTGVRTSSPKYRVLLGTSAGASDINNITSDTTSVQASNLPSNGSTIHVTLYTYFTDNSSQTDAKSCTAVTYTAASVSSPSNGSTLTSKTVTFTLSGGVGVRTSSPKYRLLLGTTAGASDINNITSDTTSIQASNLPSNGSTIYARLITYFTDDSSSYNSTSYTAVTYTAASVSSPTNGNTLTSKTATFSWSGGVGVTTGSPKYRLLLGTTAGASDINNITSDSTSVQASNLPSNGSTIYAKLITYFTDNSSSYNSSSYTAVTYTKATISSPTQGETLTSHVKTVSWTAGAGVRPTNKYKLLLGSTSGASDINNIQTDNTNIQVGNLPTNGSTIYLTLYTYFTDDSNQTDTKSCTAVTYTKSSVQTPTPGSMFSGASQAFIWNTGSGIGATPYRLTISSTGAGGTDRYDSGWTSNTNVNSGDVLYASGATAYVRLYTKFTNDSNQYDDYTYTFVTKSAVTSPTNGNTLTNSTVTFNYSSATGTLDANPYQLLIGTTGVGSSDVYAGSFISATSKEVTGIPTNGSTIYVRLLTKWADTYTRSNDYTYTAATYTAAAISNPSAGATLDGPNDVFSWSAGAGLAASPYHLTIGTAQGGTDVYDSSWIATTSKTVTTLTTDDGTAYVRLQTKYSDNSTTNNDYTYNFAYKAAITSPATSSALPGATATFTRNNATGTLNATPYRLIIGTIVAGTDVYDSGWSTASSFTATSIPTNGGYVYTRLQTKYATGETRNRDYTYTCYSGNTKALITSPSTSTALDKGLIEFTWSAGNNLKSGYPYRLQVGTGTATNNIYEKYFTSSASYGRVGNIPLDGGDVKVTLTTYFNNNTSSSDVKTYDTVTNPSPICTSCSSCGESWQLVNSKSGTTAKIFREIATNSDGSLMIAVGDLGVMWRSSDGTNWTKGQIPGGPVYDIMYAPTIDKWLAVGWNGRIYVSSNDGDSWTQKTSPTTGTLNSIAFDGSSTFLVAGDGIYNDSHQLVDHTFIRSTDGGNTWTDIKNNIPQSNYTSIAYGNGTYCVFNGTGKVYTSTNSGNSWTDRGYLPGSGVYTRKAVQSQLYSNGKFIVGGRLTNGTDGNDQGIAIWNSTDNGATWSLAFLKTGTSVKGQYVYDFTYTGYRYIGSIAGNRYVTSTDGTNWTWKTNGAATAHILGVTYANGVVVGVGTNENIILSNCSTMATMTSPGFGEAISTEDYTFKWTNVGTNYVLSVGTTEFGDDIFEGSTTNAQQLVTGIPIEGETLYVSLLSKINGYWYEKYYEYSCISDPPDMPVSLSPEDEAKLGSITETDLIVKVTDPEGDTVDVNFWGREIDDSCDFKVCVIPDSQRLAQERPDVLNDTMDGIIAMKPAAVIHVGDSVQTYSDSAQWANAKTGIDRLKAGGIKYIITPGNHDRATSGSPTSDSANWRNAYPLSDFTSLGWVGSGYYSSDQDSRYCKFNAGGLQWGVLSLEYGASYYTAAGTYLEGIASGDTNRRFILVSHGLIEGSYQNTVPVGSWVDQGSAVYEAMKDHSNIDFMLCGHRLGSTYRGDTYSGNTIYTMISNWQDSYPVPYPNHLPWEGWLRILVFSPKTNHVLVRTYKTMPEEYDWRPGNQYHLDYAMGGSPASYTKIGTVSNVSSGGTATLTWSGLQANKTYEWYATVSDGTNIVEGAIFRFKTSGSTSYSIATMASPSDGTQLQNSTVTFTWNKSTYPDTTNYWVDIGTSEGGWDINDSGQLGSNVTSWTCYNIPTDGSEVHVTLSSKVSGTWQHNHYTYPTGTINIATMSSPSNGTTLTNSTVAFNWNKSTEAGTTNYWVDVGTSEGGWDINDSGQLGSNVSTWTCHNILINGNNTYVTLSTKISGTWYHNHYTYPTNQYTIAAMTSPSDGSTLTNSTVTFNWSKSTNPSATNYWVDVGTVPYPVDERPNGPYYWDINDSGLLGSNVSTWTCYNIPINNNNFYVRLSTKISSVWYSNNYVYDTCSVTPAVMTSPLNRTNLTSSSTTFNWSAGVGVTEYNLQVGTAANSTAYDNYTNSTAISRNVTGLPTDGSTIYVKLRSKINGTYQENNYTYTALKNAPSGMHSYLTAGDKIMVYHSTSDEHLYFNCTSSQVGYAMQIIKESDNKYITIYQSEPNKVNLLTGDAIKAYVRNGSFTYSLSSSYPYFVLWNSTTDGYSTIWSSDVPGDMYKPWRSWGGTANPMVVKGPDDSYYYVYFAVCTDTDGNRYDVNDEADFSHFLGIARTSAFAQPSATTSAWEIRTQLPSPDNYCWKPWWRPNSGDTYGWNRPRLLDDITGAQLTSIRTNYHADQTQGLLGSICYYNGLYYFFYSDQDASNNWYLYYRTTPDIDELQAATSWTAAAKANNRKLPDFTSVKVAPAYDMDRWAVIYTAFRTGENDPYVSDVMVQYTDNMNVVGTGGISDIIFIDGSSYATDSHHLGRVIGSFPANNQNPGSACYQHYFMTDPAGRLAVPDGEPQNAASGGLVTFTDHFVGIYGGKVYLIGWDLYVPQTTDPSPADVATGVSTSADISWDAGYKATSYNVYFGTATNPPQVSNQVTTTYDPGTLQSATTYYWRVDAINGDDGSLTIGKTWSFTTQ